MRGLYAIIDTDSLRARGIEPIAFAERVLAAKPCAVQLRAKALGGRRTLEILRSLTAMCRSAGVPLFANDRADLALLASTDGVHVGQDDIPVELVRRVAPGLRVGVSTHSLAQLDAALAQRPDYVAFGPVFATQSKSNPDPVVGLDGLVRAAERARAHGVPLVAIGGIDLNRAPAVGASGAVAAVIGALLPVGPDLSEVTERARALSRAVLEG
jgi:thiamine-phosphate pyrophosphorylase